MDEWTYDRASKICTCEFRTRATKKKKRKHESKEQKKTDRRKAEGVACCSYLTLLGTCFNKTLSLSVRAQGYTVHHRGRIKIQ